MATKGFLGIDAGTQGLSIIFTDENLQVLAVGEGEYDMIPGMDEGCYEQNPADWDQAMMDAMQRLRAALETKGIEMEIACIGISGQMHGEVLADENGQSLGPARLWCDARNDEEGHELTELFGVKMPKRITAARWLWTTRNRPEIAGKAKHMTTPSGWIAYRLTGEWNLGIGDAAGMFPIDQQTLDYDVPLLNRFDEKYAGDFAPLKSLLPNVKKAGENAGQLTEAGSSLLGLPQGIPVAAAEGDQPAALAGSLIGKAGMVSVSFGPSVCANSVGDRAFQGVSHAIDHFCAADGKPINMVWLRNGTTYMNCLVEAIGMALPDGQNAFATIMPEVVNAAPDCGGIVALPFMDDEPGLEVERGGTACLIGLNPANATPANMVKAALLASMFNLKIGSGILDEQGFPRTELVLTGGLTKTPELGQVLADVFQTPVTLLDSADEGTAWGAALMARYRFDSIEGATTCWDEFLSSQGTGDTTRFEPNSENANAYETVFAKYRKLLAAQPELNNAVS